MPSLPQRVAARHFVAAHPIVAKYAAKLAELGLKVDNVDAVRLIPVDPAVRAALPMMQMVDAGVVGQLTLSRPWRDDRLSADVLADLRALRVKIKRKRLGAQAVSFVRVHPDWKGKGLGTILYEIALYNAYDGFGTAVSCAIVPASAIGSTTSAEAEHVWDALKKRHPHVGSVVVYK